MNSNTNSNQLLKAEAFKALHQQPDTFVMPCAWDPLTAIIFEQSGFQCIGTTSGGVNWAKGRRDFVYSVPREEMLCDYGNIACATSLPVSGDLENGYGESCREVENTIKQSIDFGMVGGSIEDMDMVANGNLIDVELAVERIVAARESADSTAIPYTLTARCEVYSTNCENPYAVAVDRLNRFREAGADCLFVPGLSSPEDLANLVSDVDGPISFGMGATEQPLSVSLLSELGVRRISTGGGIARAAFSLVRTAAEKILTDGTFEYLENAISDPMINQYLLNHRTTESK